ncbi:MAG: thioredoxin [Synechococcales bacterium]|nr:thioredoxin [Synechococcales bacterium]
MAHPSMVTLNQETFDAEVLNAHQVVLVDVWAPWCGPCRVIGPIVEAIADDFAGRVKVGKLNIDDNGAIATRYGIHAIPTLLFFKDGQVVDQIVGLASREALTARLNALLQGDAAAA